METTTEETKVVQGVLIYSELEEQVQLDELLDSIEKGFKVTKPLGGGVLLLTKEPIQIRYVDADRLCTQFRNHRETGTILRVVLSDANSTELEIHINKVL